MWDYILYFFMLFLKSISDNLLWIISAVYIVFKVDRFQKDIKSLKQTTAEIENTQNQILRILIEIREKNNL